MASGYMTLKFCQASTKMAFLLSHYVMLSLKSLRLFIPDHGGWLLFCGDLQFSLECVNLPLISRKKYKWIVEETIDMSSRELLHHNQNLPGGKVIKVWCTWQFEGKKMWCCFLRQEQITTSHGNDRFFPKSWQRQSWRDIHQQSGWEKNDSGIIFSVF